MKAEKIIFKNSKGQKIVGDLFLPDIKSKAPIAILVHGYRSDRKNSKATKLAKKLPEKGIAFLTIDLSGRGESEGKFENSTVTQYIDDLKSTIDHVATLDMINKKKISVIGSSLGGLISLQEIINDKRVKALVLMSPVSCFPWKKTGNFSYDKIKEWKQKGYLHTEPARFGKLKINYTFYEDGTQYGDISVYKQISIPVLIIHGTADESVNIEASRKLKQQIKKSKIIEMEGTDHPYSKPEDHDRLINETAKFLTEVLK